MATNQRGLGPQWRESIAYGKPWGARRCVGPLNRSSVRLPSLVGKQAHAMFARAPSPQR
jgi:hypothetical protein